MISDINRAWEELERAEHERELALRDELVRYGKISVLFCHFSDYNVQLQLVECLNVADVTVISTHSTERHKV